MSDKFKGMTKAELFAVANQLSDKLDEKEKLINRLRNQHAREIGNLRSTFAETEEHLHDRITKLEQQMEALK